jgi:hypothetical protein
VDRSEVAHPGDDVGLRGALDLQPASAFVAVQVAERQDRRAKQAAPFIDRPPEVVSSR